MPIVFLDGPEKAGKTTLARLLQSEFGFRYRHFGAELRAGELYDLTFLAYLKEDALDPTPVVWDRTWASEVVYGTHYCRARRLARDPWLGEWLYGRLAQTLGLRAMLLGPDEATLRQNRTPDDHDMPVANERRAFAQYASQYHWEYCLENEHTASAAYSLAEAMAMRARVRCALQYGGAMSVPGYVGPPDPEVLVIGESRNAWGQYPGAWAPFTSWYTTRFGRLLGNRGLTYGWTNADVVTDEAILNAPMVITCGGVAEHRVLGLRAPDETVIRVPHPAWFYRWGRVRSGVSEIEARLLRELGQFGVRPEEALAVTA